MIEKSPKKGDFIHDKTFGEYGVVNKVKGKVAYVKFPSTGATSFDPVMLSGLKPSSEKRKGKRVFVSEVICADQSHRYESIAPDHDGKAAPYGSGYDKVTEDYSQRARNFRVALRRRLASMKKGKKIKYGKLTFTALGNGNFKDSKGKTVPSENIVQTMKFAVQSDIMQHRGAAGDDMVNAYLKFEGKVNEISVPAKFSDEVFKVPPSKMNREHVLKVAKKYNVDPKLAIQHVNQVGRLKLKEATSLWKHFDAKMKLQDEIMDLEMDMKMINRDLSQLHKDMEQEAEPEGGPKATRYGRDIEKKEKEYKKKKAEFKKLMAKLDRMEQY